MSNLKEFFKERKEKDLKFRFGDDVKIMGDTFQFTHFKNNDEIIIATNNVKYWSNKDQYVLVVANNKVVYLKPWQVTPIKNWNDGLGNSYAVKLSRKFFKAYQMPFEFEDMMFEKEDTFDSLAEVAKEQDSINIAWKLGHYECLED